MPLVPPTILSRRWPATARSLPEARHATIDALAQAGVGDRQLLAAIALALSEAFANAVRYAYPDSVGDVDLTVDHDTNNITVMVADIGVGIGRPTREPGLGLGLQLISALTTTFTVVSDTTGTTLTMRFNPNRRPRRRRGRPRRPRDAGLVKALADSASGQFLEASQERRFVVRRTGHSCGMRDDQTRRADEKTAEPVGARVTTPEVAPIFSGRKSSLEIGGTVITFQSRRPPKPSPDARPSSTD